MTIEDPRFSDVVRKYLAQAKQKYRYSYEIIAQKANLPKTTISNWANDIVQKPQEWEALARFAHAIELDATEFCELLKAAGYPSVIELFALANANHDERQLALLTTWIKQKENDRPTTAVAPTKIVFQSIPALTKLVGRVDEFQQLKDILITGGCICVLRGMSGVGKTVLAAKAAHELYEAFPDGVLWAQLDKSNVEAILRSFAKAYEHDVSECHDEGTLGATVRTLFANKKALIILDTAYSEEATRALLPARTGGTAVVITTTSRELLEELVTISIDIKPFDTTDSLALFRVSLGEGRVHEAERELQQIIDLVGGLPLALKIIASNLAQMADSITVGEYYALLHDEQIRRNELYEGNEASNHVRVSFEVSYLLLKPRLKKLVACLSLFKGTDFSVEAAASVFNIPVTQLKMEMRHLYALSLVEASTVKDYYLHSPVRQGIPYRPERYRLHTMLAFFAEEKLTEDFKEELPVYQRRAVAYYADLVRANQDNFQLLELEWKNIVVVLPWAIAQGEFKIFLDTIEALTAIKVGVIGFLDAQGHWREAFSLLRQALDASMVSPDALQLATLHLKLGVFALRLADHRRAETNLQQVLTTLTTVPESEAALLCGGYTREAFAQLMLARGQPKQAHDWAKEGIDAVQRVSTIATQSLEGYLKIRLATILARNFGDLTGARLEIEQGLKLLPDQPTAAHVSGLMTLGIICNLQGEPKRAKEYWQAGVKAAEATGDNRRLAGLWRNLAAQADEEGNFAESLQYNQEALALYHHIGDVEGEALVTSNLAFTYLTQQGDAEKARPYLEAAEKLAQAHQLPDVELFAMVNRAHWYLHFQAYAKASALLHEAGKRSEEIGEKSSQAEILRLQAGIALHNQAYVNALALIEQSLKVAGENELEAGIGFRLQGDIYKAMNEADQAQKAYQQSIKLLAQYPFEKVKTQQALG